VVAVGCAFSPILFTSPTFLSFCLALSHSLLVSFFEKMSSGSEESFMVWWCNMNDTHQHFTLLKYDGHGFEIITFAYHPHICIIWRGEKSSMNWKWMCMCVRQRCIFCHNFSKYLASFSKLVQVKKGADEGANMIYWAHLFSIW